MRTVSMREANQKFSAFIAEVENGEHLVVERRGVPVAEIIPFRPKLEGEEREQALKRMLEVLERGLPLGNEKFPSRDELYDR